MSITVSVSPIGGAIIKRWRVEFEGKEVTVILESDAQMIRKMIERAKHMGYTEGYTQGFTHGKGVLRVENDRPRLTRG